MCNVIFVLFLLCAPACVTSQGNLLNSLGLTNVLSGSSGGTSGLISGGNVVNTAGSLPVVGSSAGSLTGSVSSALGIIQNNLGQVLGTLPIIGNIFGGLGSGSGSGPNTTPSPTFPNVSLPSVTPLPGLDNGGMLCLVNVLKKLPLLLGLPALNGFQPSMFLLNGGTITVANILDIKINLDCFCNDKANILQLLDYCPKDINRICKFECLTFQLKYVTSSYVFVCNILGLVFKNPKFPLCCLTSGGPLPLDGSCVTTIGLLNCLC